MDQEVARTLAQLEQKLRELEGELASLGQQTTQPPPPVERRHPVEPPPRAIEPSSPFGPHGAVEPSRFEPHGAVEPPRAAEPPPRAAEPYPRFEPSPAVEPHRPVARGLGRLVDEAVEPAAGRYSPGVQETAYGEIPATRDEQEGVELGELVRFREKLQRTLQDLIDEYSRLLSPKPRR